MEENKQIRTYSDFLESITLIIERIVSRQHGQVNRAIELSNNNLQQVSDNISGLGQTLSALHQDLSKFNPLTKEDLNKAVNFLISKLNNANNNDPNAALGQVVTALNELIPTLSQTQSSNFSNAPAAIQAINGLSSQVALLVKQQQLHHSQLQELIKFMNNSSLSLPDPNTNSNINQSKLPSNQASNPTKPTKPATYFNERVISIAGITYSLTPKTLKTIAFVAICIIALIAMFK